MPVKVPTRDVEDQDNSSRRSDADSAIGKREASLESLREDDAGSQASGPAGSKRSLRWKGQVTVSR